jgi:mRNA-degrading endonuclease toxin of MazEF toxin-antitoxin module
MLRPAVSGGEGLVAVLPNVLAIPKGRLGAERRQMTETEMIKVRVGLTELLALTYLRRRTPVNAPAPGGSTVDYPRWGEIYYAGPLIDGIRKRYVVVSNDFWNQQPDRIHLVVRTTSQNKSPGTAFPEIEHGAARACCGDLTSFRSASFDMLGRPTPERLDLADMVRVANGLAEVLDFST